MTLEEFKSTLKNESAPEGITGQLLALWYDGKGDWNKAHETAQEIDNQEGAWIHAYLHRKEGDESNAAYWYSRAGRKFSRLSLNDEWDEIASNMLEQVKAI